MVYDKTLTKLSLEKSHFRKLPRPQQKCVVPERRARMTHSHLHLDNIALLSWLWSSHENTMYPFIPIHCHLTTLFLSLKSHAGLRFYKYLKVCILIPSLHPRPHSSSPASFPHWTSSLQKYLCTSAFQGSHISLNWSTSPSKQRFFPALREWQFSAVWIIQFQTQQMINDHFSHNF